MPVLTTNSTVSVGTEFLTNDAVKVVVGATGYVNFGSGTLSLVEVYDGGYEKVLKTYTAAETLPEIFYFPAKTMELRLAGATSPSLFVSLEVIKLS